MYQSGVHGKKRGFGRGLLLVIVTFGIYAYYWHYKALKEIYDQEKKPDFPIALFIISLIPFINVVGQLLFMSQLLTTVNTVRIQRQLAPTFNLGGFLGWYVLGALIIVGPFVAYYKLQMAINEYWDVETQRQLQPPAAPTIPATAGPA